jgi:preprotein translocase subunit SecA
MDVMEEGGRARRLASSTDKDLSEWNVRALTDWVNLFLSGMTEGSQKVAEEGTEEPVKGSLYGELTKQFAVVDSSARRCARLTAKVTSSPTPSSPRSDTILNVDKLWQEHLYEMDHLRTSIGLLRPASGIR